MKNEKKKILALMWRTGALVIMVVVWLTVTNPRQDADTKSPATSPTSPAALQTDKTYDIKSWKRTDEDTHFGYTFEYPADWRLAEYEGVYTFNSKFNDDKSDDYDFVFTSDSLADDMEKYFKDVVGIDGNTVLIDNELEINGFPARFWYYKTDYPDTEQYTATVVIEAVGLPEIQRYGETVPADRRNIRFSITGRDGKPLPDEDLNLLLQIAKSTRITKNENK